MDYNAHRNLWWEEYVSSSNRELSKLHKVETKELNEKILKEKGQIG